MANSLISEKSPYLLQHASNPVDWLPWSDEAFRLAKERDKPVFLSIGYSTCHWCHVMARESFDDQSVARLINEAFVPIKVDREERPDIDNIYMKVCQMMTGRGGWPLTIIMTPDKKPFFAATYIPKEGKFGSAGLLELIPRIKDLWKNDRARLIDSAEKVFDRLSMYSRPASGPGSALDESILNAAYLELSDLFDPQNGGFGSAPKFPTPHNLLFLLRYWRRTGDANALNMVEVTLQAMRMGGIYDHVGFGFHRYSTDAVWAIPHFEKMLYDQALLAIAYAQAYQATGLEDYARTSREILTYVQRDMTSEMGGFYSAEDADSEGMEGKFYLWMIEEIKAQVDKDEYSLLSKLFDLSDKDNFEMGMNVLSLRSSLEDASMILQMPKVDLQDKLEAIRHKLFNAREKRVRPHKDDKILTDWNGLMIAAFACASRILEEPDYAQAAKDAADFILSKLRQPDGRLLHRYREVPGIDGNLDDYSFMIFGLLELYEADFDPRYLKHAMDLGRIMIEHFWDDKLGGFYFTPDDGEVLLARQKEIYDGAVPSGNSVAMLDLIKLFHLTGDHHYEEIAELIAQAFSSQIGRRPSASTMLMASLDFALGPVNEVVIVGNPGSQDTLSMLKALRSFYIPNMVAILVPYEAQTADTLKIAPYVESLVPIEGKATAYVCADRACRLPTTDPSKMLELLLPPKEAQGRDADNVRSRTERHR